MLTPEQLLDQVDDAVGALDQPTMDGLNTYFVSRAAHQAGLKVALSGLGSDEIFGGYSTFTSTPRASMVAGLGRWIPGPFRRLSAALATQNRARRCGSQSRRDLEVAVTDFPHAYFFTRLLYTPARVDRLLAPYFESRRIWRKRRIQLARAHEGDRAAGRAPRFLYGHFLS